MFKLGLIVNPFAGLGGSVALKGSDGVDTRQLALAKGAIPMAQARATQALKQLSDQDNTDSADIEIYTVSGEMGEQAAKDAGFEPNIVLTVEQPSMPQDTENAVAELLKHSLDLILFAGGDGTARNVAAAFEGEVPVLGIPAGCKIHSGVYAITPKAAGQLTREMATGKMLSLNEASVMDIDEQAFRAGTVRAKQYAEMNVPHSLEYVQATKQGGKEVEALVLDDIAAHVIEAMEPGVCYVMGSGSTCAAIMEHLGLENTLLGVDVIKDQKVLLNDATAGDLMALVQQGESIEVVITLIGGQGHLLGRGNQQLSADFIRAVGWSNVSIVATKAKLKALQERPLIVDSGDPELDEDLSGTKAVVTGYHDQVLYRVGR